MPRPRRCASKTPQRAPLRSNQRSSSRSEKTQMFNVIESPATQSSMLESQPKQRERPLQADAHEVLATPRPSKLQGMALTKKLMSQWVKDKPADYQEQIADMFTAFPSAIGERCVHSGRGFKVTGNPDYLPSVQAIRRWCANELAYWEMLAKDPPPPPSSPAPASAEDKAKVAARAA